ncbi:MAG: hypothetical protein QW384_04565 [Archaeoglobaceae archaeon]
MEDSTENPMLIIAFITVVLFGCVVFPTLIILFFLSGKFWEIPVFFTAICLILSLIISKNIERRKKAQKIRSGVKSRRIWMSLADYGASFGKIEKRRSKKKSSIVQEEDRWSYLRRILEKSDSEVKIKKL